MYKEYTREATKEESYNYNHIEEITKDWEDDYFDKMVEIVGSYVWAISKEERKASYNRLYKLAKQYNTTPKMWEDWYCIDTY